MSWTHTHTSSPLWHYESYLPNILRWRYVIGENEPQATNTSGVLLSSIYKKVNYWSLSPISKHVWMYNIYTLAPVRTLHDVWQVVAWKDIIVVKAVSTIWLWWSAISRRWWSIVCAHDRLSLFFLVCVQVRQWAERGIRRVCGKRPGRKREVKMCPLSFWLLTLKAIHSSLIRSGWWQTRAPSHNHR